MEARTTEAELDRRRVWLVPIDERVRFDNRYIDQHSLFLDAVIAVRTIGSLFRSKHAY